MAAPMSIFISEAERFHSKLLNYYYKVFYTTLYEEQSALQKQTNKEITFCCNATFTTYNF